MVFFGGLEFVAAGYVVHRYHKNKNEKKRLVEDAHQRRQNTFPGSGPHTPRPYQQQQPAIPQQKYACYAPQPQPPSQFQPRPHTAQPHSQAQPFTVPRRPLPGPSPPFQQQVQPLQRADSMATLSRMPVADGRRYRDNHAPLPPQPELLYTQSMPQQPVNYPYYQTGFSASYPSFGPSSAAPVGNSVSRPGGGHTVDDNWETSGQPSPHVHFAPSVSTQLGEEGEDNPPPPYRP